MYIEANAAEYREWNSKNTINQKKRKIGMSYTHQSLDTGVPDTDVEALHECVPSGFNLEGVVAGSYGRTEMRTAGLEALGGGTDGSLHGRGKAFLHKRFVQKVPT